jgi:sulfoxide reductase heme-binding subunit YedZ
MSVRYQAIGWNRRKRIYDLVLTGSVIGYLLIFTGLGALIHPNATVETLLIRGFGTAALLLLHVILCIGPLCRLDRRFLPLLYNRRHMGVTMFMLALAHGVFALIQFHGFGDVHPLVSVLTSNVHFGSVADFPFQQLGLLALAILFLMAATSHDFWLNQLTPPVWKRLHMLVYAAYGLLTGHVALGALQSETSPLLVIVSGTGMAVVIALHLAAARKEHRQDTDGYVEACPLKSIPENQAVIVNVAGERVAVFRYGGKVSAISNVCKHQNGPLGEGRIIDGCVTCPWHGYQYLPDTGASPPPFTEKVAVFRTRIEGERVLVHPCAYSPGTYAEPSVIPAEAMEARL